MTLLPHILQLRASVFTILRICGFLYPQIQRFAPRPAGHQALAKRMDKKQWMSAGTAAPSSPS
jgi:hypothetical protein